MQPLHPFVETYRQILREQVPNLFRLYLNPYVAQACLCLARYVHSTWDGTTEADDFQSFLANASFTIATRPDSARSRSVKSRPPSSGMPMLAK